MLQVHTFTHPSPATDLPPHEAVARELSAPLRGARYDCQDALEAG
jgi:hypothetical protein